MPYCQLYGFEIAHYVHLNILIIWYFDTLDTFSSDIHDVSIMNKYEGLLCQCTLKRGKKNSL